MKIFAIGDIHGMYDHMARAVSWIAPQLKENDKVVFLGDYIDRGPESAACLQMIKPLSNYSGFHFLRGNHEDMFCDPMCHTGIDWPETMRSLERDDMNVQEATDIIMNHTEHVVKIGRYVFVHAGVRPEIPLTEQSEDDVMWIRNEFMIFPGSMQMLPDVKDAVIVHGHTPMKHPHVVKNRVSIDTGCCFENGYLTVAMIDPDKEPEDIVFHSVK